MANTSFEELIKREAANREAKVDLAKERDEWLRRLRSLIDQVRGFLTEYLQDGTVKVQETAVELNEEQVGSYLAPQLTIVIGSKTIKLEPVGTFILGSKGRVDVVGPRGRARLLLLDKDVKQASDLVRVTIGIGGRPPAPIKRKDPAQIDWIWRIMAAPPEMNIGELNKDSFLSLLAEVANG